MGRRIAGEGFGKLASWDRQRIALAEGTSAVVPPVFVSRQKRLRTHVNRGPTVEFKASPVRTPYKRCDPGRLLDRAV